MSKPYQIIEVGNSKKWHRAFVDMPWPLYTDDPYWVPPLKLAMEDILSPKHPFYLQGKMKRWVAVGEQGEIAGRIAAIIDEAANSFHQEKSGMFGFFECRHHPALAQDLFLVAENYLRSEGMKQIKGPFHPSSNYECGLLVEGFDDPPQLMMTYNPSYYEELLLANNLRPCMDLLAYRLPIQTQFPAKIIKVAERIQNSAHIKIRPLRKSHWDEDIQIMKDIYNDAWEKNWGFVPMSEEEFAHLAKTLKSVALPELVLFVEVGGKPVGFLVALPDYNQIFKKIPSGKLFPLGLLQILFGKRQMNRARIITLGIKKDYRTLGLSTLLYLEIKKQFEKLPQYQEVEMSWILANNELMNKPLRLMQAQVYKRYRLYEKSLC